MPPQQHHDGDDRLARIETFVARIDERTADLCRRLEDQEKQDETVSRVLYGNHDAPGLVTQVALLKDSQERGRWLMRAVISAVVTLLVGALWALLKR